VQNGLIHTKHTKSASVCFLAACFLSVAASFGGGGEKLIGDESDGSRAVPVHLIKLIDEQGQEISPEDDPILPFSTRQTCGLCHNYDVIKTGRHFNLADSNVPSGRSGEGWIFVDAATGTQVPVSYRKWPGTFTPRQVGISDWRFLRLFGRQMTGGGVGELENLEEPQEIIRGFVSGKLEINCLACHNGAAVHDQGQYGLQIERENFRWAAAATCGFAPVSGSAKDMSDDYDYLMPDVPDDPKLVTPGITYRANSFDAKKQVFFDIVTKIPSQRCYFCHSNKIIGKDQPERWAVDEDVHMAAGLNCVDCHRNGLDHNITRGYENNTDNYQGTSIESWSCEGCHVQGRLGAPRFETAHKGLTPMHFEKISCTGCHSGSLPVQQTRMVKTSRAHALGTYNAAKADDALPHIQTPVFTADSSGKIGAHNLIWPAYWAVIQDQKVAPISIELLKQVAGKLFAAESPVGDGRGAIDTEKINEVLGLLSSSAAIEGKPVYISGGMLFAVDGGKLSEEPHPAAQPYRWAIGHNVRPAAQSLGLGGCGDCHSPDAPFLFGKVTLDSPVVSHAGRVVQMSRFQHMDVNSMKVFARLYVFRPLLAFIVLVCSALVGLIILLYGLKCLECVLKLIAHADWWSWFRDT